MRQDLPTESQSIPGSEPVQDTESQLRQSSQMRRSKDSIGAQQSQPGAGGDARSQPPKKMSPQEPISRQNIHLARCQTTPVDQQELERRMNREREKQSRLSPFKSLKRNDRVAIVLMMKVEKFILKRKYHSLFTLKSIFQRKKSEEQAEHARQLQKEQKAQQQAAVAIKLSSRVQGFNLLDKISKCKRSEYEIRFLTQLIDLQSQELQRQKLGILTQKQQGKFQLPILIMRLIHEREKAALNKIKELNQLYANYNIFNLLVNDFEKILRNII